ncbi:interleukin-12 subunit alpha [Marmota monax]|uniref:interleukin-12 subunit alpha n=1 Tax=Marmota monax TaxID=9995 RepID=UPI001EB071A5|nr:interleukin-12 subunit alpha [Marmota monax]
MCPSARSLLLLASLVLLEHLGSARNLPRSTPVPAVSQECHNLSQTLLSTVDSALQNAIEILEYYPCSAEEVNHEDITKNRTNTVKACLPQELAQNENCLASRETSFIIKRSSLTSGRTSWNTTLCFSSIYEDLKMYQLELKAISEKLLMDPKGQIYEDKALLAAVDYLMQAVNVNNETVPQTPSPEAPSPNLYRTKTKLCILLHALRIRAVTINRVMSYLNSS